MTHTEIVHLRLECLKLAQKTLSEGAGANDSPDNVATVAADYWKLVNGEEFNSVNMGTT